MAWRWQFFASWCVHPKDGAGPGQPRTVQELLVHRPEDGRLRPFFIPAVTTELSWRKRPRGDWHEVTKRGVAAMLQGAVVAPYNLLELLGMNLQHTRHEGTTG